MGIEINVRKPGGRLPAATEVAIPVQDSLEAIALPRHHRINLSLRRRRQRRLQQVLGTAAWIAGSGALLFIAAASVLSLH